MFNEFCITQIELFLADKSIIVTANFKINEETVNYNTVKLKDATTGMIEEYTLKTNGKEIIITFNDWPKQEHKYHLSISNEITDRLDRKLNASVNKTVMFESQIKYKVNIASPLNGETLKGSDLEIKVNSTPEDEYPKTYLYEVALDNAFCEVIHSFTTTEPTALFNFDKDGQYFARCRIQDPIKPNVFGEWSETIEFILIDVNKSECDSEDKVTEESQFIEDMLSMDKVLMDVIPLKIEGIYVNGSTNDEIYVYFNQDLDLSTIPEHITLRRRDL